MCIVIDRIIPDRIIGDASFIPVLVETEIKPLHVPQQIFRADEFDAEFLHRLGFR